MDVLCDDELGLILKWCDRFDRESVNQVCRRWWRLEALSRSSIYFRKPGILGDVLPRFPNLLKFRTHVPMSNADLKFLSQTCPKLEVIELDGRRDITSKKRKRVGELGLCVLANKCPKLTKIGIRGTNSISEAEILPLLTSSAHYLTHLDLESCKWVTDQSLQAIGSSSCSKTIKKLVISRCKHISDSGVSFLQNMCVLEELNLRGCRPITDNALKFLANGSVSKTMKKLVIAFCLQISEFGVLHMQKMCVLEELNLKGCYLITDDALKFLANGSISRTMKKLVIGFCPEITDNGVLHIQKMRVLEKLVLRECRITDLSLELLANGTCSKTMKKLDLSDTKITDVGLSCLKDMCVLKELKLRDCELIRADAAMVWEVGWSEGWSENHHPPATNYPGQLLEPTYLD